MRKLVNKQIAAVAAGAIIVVSAGAAYAYWTTTGEGSGSETAAAGGGVVTLHATFDSGLYPSHSVAVAYTADNANDYSTKVGALTATVATDDAGCLPSWFTVTAVTSNTTVEAGSTGTLVGSGTLSMSDLEAVDQSACMGALITINVDSV